jgi:hypothetical protein
VTGHDRLCIVNFNLLTVCLSVCLVVQINGQAIIKEMSLRIYQCAVPEYDDEHTPQDDDVQELTIGFLHFSANAVFVMIKNDDNDVFKDLFKIGSHSETYFRHQSHFMHPDKKNNPDGGKACVEASLCLVMSGHDRSFVCFVCM